METPSNLSNGAGDPPTTPLAWGAGTASGSPVAAERGRVACALHGAVSQTLFAAKLLAGAPVRADELNEAARGQVQTLERQNRSALARMRKMLFELQPETLQSVRLTELQQHAVEAMQGRDGVTVNADISPDPGLGRLHIVDDGCGSDAAALRGGRAGLDLMHRRATRAGTELSIQSAPTEGTEITLQINWN